MIPASIIFVKRENAELTQKERCWGLKFPVIPADNKNRESQKMGKLTEHKITEGRKAELAFAKVLNKEKLAFFHIDQLVDETNDTGVYSEKFQIFDIHRPDYVVYLSGFSKKPIFIDVKALSRDRRTGLFKIDNEDARRLSGLQYFTHTPVWLAITEMNSDYTDYRFVSVDSLGNPYEISPWGESDYVRDVPEDKDLFVNRIREIRKKTNKSYAYFLKKEKYKIKQSVSLFFRPGGKEIDKVSMNTKVTVLSHVKVKRAWCPGYYLIETRDGRIGWIYESAGPQGKTWEPTLEKMSIDSGEKTG
jgi:hypothetical protein